jgi:hypothetical protein
MKGSMMVLTPNKFSSLYKNHVRVKVYSQYQFSPYSMVKAYGGCANKPLLVQFFAGKTKRNGYIAESNHNGISKCTLIAIISKIKQIVAALIT